MELVDVTRTSPALLSAGQGIVRVEFKILGALKAFEFPFENNSLTEKKIIFIRGGNNG